MKTQDKKFAEQLENCAKVADYRTLTRGALETALDNRKDWRARLDEIIEIAEQSNNLNGEKSGLLNELHTIRDTSEAIRDKEARDFIRLAFRRNDRITRLDEFRQWQRNTAPASRN